MLIDAAVTLPWQQIQVTYQLITIDKKNRVNFTTLLLRIQLHGCSHFHLIKLLFGTQFILDLLPVEEATALLHSQHCSLNVFQ